MSATVDNPFMTIGSLTVADSATTTAAGLIAGQTHKLSTPTAGSAVVAPLFGLGIFRITLAGDWVATVQFETSSDGGRSWVPISLSAQGSATTVSTLTGAGSNDYADMYGSAAGLTHVRVRCTAFTSGPVDVTIQPGTSISPSVDIAPSSSPQPITPGTGTLTNKSGTITAGGVSQVLAAANTSRKYLFIQNLSAEDLWINFTTAAATGQPSICLATSGAANKAGGSFVMESSFITTEAVNIIGATTGSAFAAKEGN